MSRRLSAPFEGSLLNTYRMLRTINPSPYMFYFSGTDVEVAGASPETLVKLENGVLHTFPLAGTRPRGRTDEEDRALETELLANSLVNLKTISGGFMEGQSDTSILQAIWILASLSVSLIRKTERYLCEAAQALWQIPYPKRNLKSV